MKETVKNNTPAFLRTGGEMGKLTRDYDWATSSLGPAETWPQSLKSLLHLLLNSSFPMFLFWGEKLTCFYNDAYRPSLGNEGKHPFALGKPAEDVWPEIWHIIKPLIDQVLSGGGSTWHEDQLVPIHRNGRIEDVYWTFSYSPAIDDNGNIAGVFVTCTETTGKVKNLAALGASEQKFRNLIEESPVQMCLFTGSDLVVEIVNDALLDSWGIDKSVIGKSLHEALPIFFDKPVIELLNKAWHSEMPYVARELKVKLMKNGSLKEHYFNIWYNPVFDEQENIYGILATGVDVTPEIEARNQSKKSELFARNIFINSVAAQCVWTGEYMIITLANEKMLEMWGRDESIIGLPFMEALPELQQTPVLERLQHVLHTSEMYFKAEEKFDLVRYGKPYTGYYTYTYKALQDASGKNYGVICTATEITEQVLAKQKLQMSEERLRIAVEGAGLGTFELNYATDEFICTDRFYDIFGFDHPVPVTEYVTVIHPDDRAVRTSAHEKAISSGKLFYEARLKLRDNRTRWISVNGSLVKTKDGTRKRLMGIIRDITEQKNLQLQKDNFIGMASHELKTPVTAIKAYIHVVEQMLLRKGSSAEAAMMQKMDSQINRLTSLINDLLNIANINSGRLEYKQDCYNLTVLAVEITEELQRTTDTHQLKLYALEMAMVLCDRERISQVMINLISNAIKYSPESDAVEISLIVKDEKAVFSVRDFGIGIDIESQPKVFEQFFRVGNQKHQSFQGFGLGLFISSEIIKREGGKIWVESEENVGSTFSFMLPLMCEE